MKPGVIEEQRPGSLVRDEDIEAVVQAIGQNFQPEKIVLFGSYAGGAPSADSDLDLLVIMDSDLPRHKRDPDSAALSALPLRHGHCRLHP